MKRDHVRRLAFRLALACGRWDVDALLDEMTPRQWAQWQTFDRLEPIGGVADTAGRRGRGDVRPDEVDRVAVGRGDAADRPRVGSRGAAW